MIQEKNIKWLYAISILFILINGICTFYEFYYLNLLPAAVVILLLAIFSLDKLMLLTVFLTPLAINLQKLDGGLGLSLPTEPIIFGIMLIFIMKQLYSADFDRSVLVHPISIAIYFNLLWILITTITSEYPIVSIKFLVARLWFVISFYFLGTQLFKEYKNIKRFIWLYIIPFTIVIFYTIYMHAGFGFDEKTANYVMSPFYNDHTIYGAMLAMFLPVLIFFCFNKKYSTSIKFASTIFLIIFIIALIFSYTRAAWLSLIIALLAYIVLLLKIKFRNILILASCITAVLLYYRTDIIMKLEKNRQDASRDFEKHIQSISNISTDASNLERLNRWSAAFGMFEERPILGWGPGTYSFVYAPFQHSNEKTIISTNMGDRGNAHSEYIGPLCESGVLGAVTFIIIILITLSTGFRLYYTISDYELKKLVLVTLLGFITYIVHGGLNNFLDTDKASVPFWGFIAMLVAIDVHHKKNQEKKISEPSH
ncbi:MAG: O-antigen ligase family protein [Bacteroidetes bacterium]|nr:O-antigen ligase family protein [Bacteroidota bacterium]